MKKTLFIVALVAIIFSGCTKQKSQEPSLQLTSEPTLQFDENGGQLRITYELLNVDESAQVSISYTEDWFEATETQRGTILVDVEKNTLLEERTGTIVITYESLSESVVIRQSASSEDNSLELGMLVGQYNGNKYSAVPNYYFCLTDNGFETKEDPLPNSIYYRIDLYSEQVPEDVKNIKIPNGTYTLDLQNTYADGTFSQEYSFYLATSERATNEYALFFSESTLYVTDDKVQLMAVTEDGQLHNVVFNGEYILENKSGQGEGILSDLTDDYEAQVSNNFAICEFYGDFYGCGYGNWMILLRNPEGGDEIQLDFLYEGNSFDAGFAGNYVCKSDFSEMTLTPGYPEGSGYVGCWYFEQIDGSLSGRKAPFTEGSTMTITDNGDGTFTIAVLAYDDTPERHELTFEWTGPIEAEDYSYMFNAPPAPVTPLKVYAR